MNNRQQSVDIIPELRPSSILITENNNAHKPLKYLVHDTTSTTTTADSAGHIRWVAWQRLIIINDVVFGLLFLSLFSSLSSIEMCFHTSRTALAKSQFDETLSFVSYSVCVLDFHGSASNESYIAQCTEQITDRVVNRHVNASNETHSERSRMEWAETKQKTDYCFEFHNLESVLSASVNSSIGH